MNCISEMYNKTKQNQIKEIKSREKKERKKKPKKSSHKGIIFGFENDRGMKDAAIYEE